MKMFFGTRQAMRNFSATTPAVVNGKKDATRQDKARQWAAEIKPRVVVYQGPK